MGTIKYTVINVKQAQMYKKCKILDVENKILKVVNNWNRIEFKFCLKIRLAV